MRLPPLNALRAFETVARHGGLSRAAEELGVTPTAVSRHIKNLEDALGVPLFNREPGVLELTSRGRSYARTLTRSFDLMLDATNLLDTRTVYEQQVFGDSTATPGAKPVYMDSGWSRVDRRYQLGVRVKF